MKQLFICMAMVWVVTLSSFAQSGIFGKWKTIDDETGKPKSVVDIYQKDGKAYGKIIRLFPEPGEDPDPVCDEWADGEILDPENGKLKVRGYIAFFYRTQTWLKIG